MHYKHIRRFAQLAWHARGHRFESDILHDKKINLKPPQMHFWRGFLFISIKIVIGIFLKTIANIHAFYVFLYENV